MMKYVHRMIVLSIFTGMMFGSCYSEESSKNKTETNTQNTGDDKIDIVLISEAFGHFIGKNLNSPGVSFDLEAMIKGIREGAAGKQAPMSDKDYEAAMKKLQERAFEKLSSENLKAANEFMKSNIQNKDVIEIEPGKLQYLTLQEGSNEKVQPHGTPLIHYTGKYLDDKVFGSSLEAGGPITISLDQTIPGFSKGLVGMKEGEKRRLFIHPDLGYGTLGNLPPNALLIFDIEVIKADSQNENQDKVSMMEDDYDEDEEDEDNSVTYNPDEDGEEDENEDFGNSKKYFDGGSLKR